VSRCGSAHSRGVCPQCGASVRVLQGFWHASYWGATTIPTRERVRERVPTERTLEILVKIFGENLRAPMKQISEWDPQLENEFSQPEGFGGSFWFSGLGLASTQKFSGRTVFWAFWWSRHRPWFRARP